MSSSPQPSQTVRHGDKRYPALSRGFNQRWIATPEYVRLVRSPEDARASLEAAVRETPKNPDRKRITVRSGGHCYEDFVCGTDVRVILDVSPMCDMYHDSDMDAYCVEAGAGNWHGYSHLYPMSGKALPGGSCYSVGLGGHITGGGYGLLSRQFGLTVDYLYAVEVAVVKPDRSVELVVAKRDDPDPDLKRLWWAHTGGGGGNFGLITRFWFRDLPEPPSMVMLAGLAWDWKHFTKDDFTSLLTAFGTYFRDNQDPSTAAGKLFAMLVLNHFSNGQIGLLAQVDIDDPGGRAAMKEFIEKVDGGIGPKATAMRTSMGERPTVAQAQIPRDMPWLTATQALDSSGEDQCGKYKSAYISKPFDAAQMDAMWVGLNENGHPGYSNKQSVIQIDSYGGAINRPPRDTAARQRGSIMKMQYQVYWTKNDQKEADYLAWIRDTYKATFAKTGGVPVVGGDNTDGCYINYPDVDLNDTEKWNRSTQKWWTLYYKDAYSTLQQVKKRWDPLNVFHSTQSVRLPD
ncbi:FAD-binding oxidoreductase [Actinomadura darangshiensis]|uniref:FAD-binding oxidoreductase n=1 Tax=Actinomadura darangshiensis TaxID=705336 RepID=A0A4R5B6D3_9ACTN|nr:BBE domain-containing protein [Actinomadura darangshiensis]TDD80885.1 FAD-binding oxidoreductase [Actinomadura darangshiensis]